MNYHNNPALAGLVSASFPGQKIGYFGGVNPGSRSLQTAYPRDDQLPFGNVDGSVVVANQDSDNPDSFPVTVVRENEIYYFEISGQVIPALCLSKGRTYTFEYNMNPERPCLFGFNDTLGLTSRYLVRGQPISQQLLLNRIRQGEIIDEITLKLYVLDYSDLDRTFYQCTGARVASNWAYFNNPASICKSVPRLSNRSV